MRLANPRRRMSFFIVLTRRVSDAEILKRTEDIIAQGVSGIVYGRNVIQHENPAGITRALMAVVHDGASSEEALKMIDEV